MLILMKGSGQDSIVLSKVTLNAVRLVKHDLRIEHLKVADVCFKLVGHYVQMQKVEDFISDTAFVFSNFTLNRPNCPCFCSYQVYYKDSDSVGKNEEYTMFLSPYYENAVVVRIARSDMILYHDNTFAAQGENYFYLLKFNDSGRIVKKRRFKIAID